MRDKRDSLAWVDARLEALASLPPEERLEGLGGLVAQLDQARVRVEREIGKTLAVLDASQVDRHHRPKEAKVVASEVLGLSSQAYCASITFGALAPETHERIEQWIGENYHAQPLSIRALLRALDGSKKGPK